MTCIINCELNILPSSYDCAIRFDWQDGRETIVKFMILDAYPFVDMYSPSSWLSLVLRSRCYVDIN